MESPHMEVLPERNPEQDDLSTYHRMKNADSMNLEESQELEIPRIESSHEGDWIDKGIVDVEVNDVDLSDSWVHNEKDFKKVSHEDMVQGFDVLDKEVRPAVENGASSDDFWESDQQIGLEYRNGTQRIYDAFYGDNSIRLTKVGDRYEVINGYHRLHVAKEIGFSSVPARVIEKVGY